MSVCGSLHRAIVVGCQNGDHRPSQCSCRSSSSSRSLKCCSYYRGTLTPATFSTIAATSQVTKFAVAATSTTATAAAAAYYATSIDAFTTNTTALFRTSASLTCRRGLRRRGLRHSHRHQGARRRRVRAWGTTAVLPAHRLVRAAVASWRSASEARASAISTLGTHAAIHRAYHRRPRGRHRRYHTRRHRRRLPGSSSRCSMNGLTTAHHLTSSRPTA